MEYTYDSTFLSESQQAQLATLLRDQQSQAALVPSPAQVYHTVQQVNYLDAAQRAASKVTFVSDALFAWCERYVVDVLNQRAADAKAGRKYTCCCATTWS